MAIYHLTTKPVPRAMGRSAPASAAYRAGDKVLEHSTGQTWDYSRKQGIEHSEIVLPTSAAQRDINWARDREQLWNAAEAAEKRKDARVAREWEVALPHELDRKHRVDLAREFAGELANRYGCAVDVAIHRPHRLGDQRNWHAHLFATTRTVEADGLGRKTDIELGDRDRGKKGLGLGADEIKAMRARWATLTNERLREHRIEARIDHRSLREQGIDREPTVHLGPSVIGMERKGIRTEVGERVREEQRREQELRLERARELGKLEREAVEVRASILDLSLDLRQALKEREPLQAAEKGTGATAAAATEQRREQTLAERLEAQIDDRASELLKDAARKREEQERASIVERRQELKHERDRTAGDESETPDKSKSKDRDHGLER